MSKLLKKFVGIDISKTWFDAALIKVEQFSQVLHYRFNQTFEGYNKIKQWL